MKKILLALAIALGIAGSASAQKAEITASYGGYTQMDATDCHDGWGNVNTAWGAVTVGLNLKVAPSLWIGPSYTISSTTTKGKNHSSILYNAILFNARYNYYHTSIFDLYAHAGLGIEISHMKPKGFDSFNKTYFAYQITPLGASVGLSQVATIFGELGFGAQGLIQVGFRFNI
ncbi:MAG: outer membrane beta-barrel protein [Bacteroidales bacterium]|nr:outer membrane beta-barrel protein [Bacteroidales bacterium]